MSENVDVGYGRNASVGTAAERHIRKDWLSLIDGGGRQKGGGVVSSHKMY